MGLKGDNAIVPTQQDTQLSCERASNCLKFKFRHFLLVTLYDYLCKDSEKFWIAKILSGFSFLSRDYFLILAIW